jgi:hypothetical protein
MVQISERNVVPEFKANAHQGRSNDKKSSGAYNQYESDDMIKIAMILHFPPVILDFNTPMNKLPYFPGADCLAKMRAGCMFYENGHCITVSTSSRPRTRALLTRFVLRSNRSRISRR